MGWRKYYYIQVDVVIISYEYDLELVYRIYMWIMVNMSDCQWMYEIYNPGNALELVGVVNTRVPFIMGADMGRYGYAIYLL